MGEVELNYKYRCFGSYKINDLGGPFHPANLTGDFNFVVIVL
jgi:hypothetical protein